LTRSYKRRNPRPVRLRHQAKRQAKRSPGSSMFVERRRPGLERRSDDRLSLTVAPCVKR
jgi:hypothetical protein